MSPRRPNFDDSSFDFEALLSDQARKDPSSSVWGDGSLNGANLNGANLNGVNLNYANQIGQRIQDNQMAPRLEPSGGQGADPVTAHSPRSRGQILSWLALVTALGLSVLIGYQAFATLDSIDVSSPDALDTARQWSAWLPLGLVAIVAVWIIAIVALFRSRPKLVATLAILLAVILPPIALVVGLKFGADAFAVRAQQQAADAGLAVGDFFVQLLSQSGIDMAPFVGLIRRLFG